MGKILYCDMCGKSVPIPEALSKITIGVAEAAEVCITCSAQLRSSITAQKQKITLDKTNPHTGNSSAAPPSAAPSDDSTDEEPVEEDDEEEELT